MKILHLSDLHITDNGRDLEDIWLAAGAAIQGERFDFVVITGDLTQQASKLEYTRLTRFLQRRIEPLILKPKGDPKRSVRPRIVLVPGNHDVSWSEQFYDEVPLAHAGASDIAKWLTDATWSPETTPYRVKQGPLGHTSLFKIAEKRYPQRFEEVDRFLKTYYRGELRRPHIAFDLLQPNATGDWAAHVFPDERIMFLAFNSCYRNDRYWHGARIHRKAIQSAKAYAEKIERKYDSSFFRVAVWHHGLESHRVRPDRLTLENLGSLMAAQIRVGFHGHVHESVSASHSFTTDAFVLVSTGSLGAASTDRPDAVGNQFSVVDLHLNRLRVDVYQLRSRSGEYERQQPKSIDLNRIRSSATAEPVRSWTASLRRRVELSLGDGIAMFTIELEDLFLRDPIVLASVEHTLHTEHDPFVIADGERLAIVVKDQPARREFYFEGRSSKKRYKQVMWRYMMSNALALNRAELAILTDRLTVHPHLPDASKYDAWAHVVQFDYDRLTLELACVDHACKPVDYLERRVASARHGRGRAATPVLQPMVEDRTGSQTWERVPAEEQRSEVSADKASFRVSWTSPLPGRRYSATFQLARPGRFVPPDQTKIIDAVVARCRDSATDGEKIRRNLDQSLRTATQVGLGHKNEEPFGEYTVAMGFLWQSAERWLRPCFGHFPPDAWMEKFLAGQGIAGHAFRFDRPAAWHRDEPGRFDVIKMPPRNKSRDYDWILAIPIFAGPDGASVGVVSFSATRNETRTAHLLAEFARQIARPVWWRKAGKWGRDEPTFMLFWWLVNLAFWSGLRQVAGSSGLPPGVERMARAHERSFQSVTKHAR